MPNDENFLFVMINQARSGRTQQAATSKKIFEVMKQIRSEFKALQSDNKEESVAMENMFSNWKALHANAINIHSDYKKTNATLNGIHKTLIATLSELKEIHEIKTKLNCRCNVPCTKCNRTDYKEAVCGDCIQQGFSISNH